MDAEAVEQGPQPGGEAVGVDGAELAARDALGEQRHQVAVPGPLDARPAARGRRRRRSASGSRPPARASSAGRGGRRGRTGRRTRRAARGPCRRRASSRAAARRRAPLAPLQGLQQQLVLASRSSRGGGRCSCRPRGRAPAMVSFSRPRSAIVVHGGGQHLLARRRRSSAAGAGTGTPAAVRAAGQTLGCCWVMQWMPPPPAKIVRASTSGHRPLREEPAEDRRPRPRRAGRRRRTGRRRRCRGSG